MSIRKTARSRASCYLFLLVKYLEAFCKGPAYETILKKKMKSVEKASQAMDEHVSLRQHLRLKDIRDDTMHGIASYL